MQVYSIGEPRQLTSSWYDADGAGMDPTVVTLTVTHPNGTTDTYTKAQLTQGATVADWFRWVTPDENGVWRYEFVGTVDGRTVEQAGIFLVDTEQGSAGPCEPWCTWDDVGSCGTPPELDLAAQELVLDQATEILFNLSGARYPGLCTTTRSLCFACWGCFPEVCACEPYGAIDLSGKYPVYGAFDVVLDGVELVPSTYTVRDRRWLVRTDGTSWPSGWNTANHPEQFRVSWVYGRQVPTGGRVAAAQFALELAKLCVKDKTCALPQRVTNIVREGVSYTILDPMSMIQEGRTGLAMVDLWLVADERGHRPRPGMFHPALGHSERMR